MYSTVAFGLIGDKLFGEEIILRTRPLTLGNRMVMFREQ